MKTIFTLVFTRLQKDKTLKFIKSFLVFLALFIGKHGANLVLELIDQVQPNLFMNILGSLWIPNITKVNGPIERKMVAVSMTKLIAECPKMLVQPYVASWPELLRITIEVLEGHEDETVPPDMGDIEAEESSGYSTAFSQLVNAHKADADPFKEVSNAKEYLASAISKASKQAPGVLPPLIQALPVQAQQVLMQYFKSLPNLTQPYLV